MASEEQWTQAYLIAQKANVLVNVGLTRLDTVRDPVHRDYVIHARKLLFLRDAGGDEAVRNSRLQFIRLQREELAGILAAWESALAAKRYDEAAGQFSAAFQCVWRIVRKALIMHGLRTRLPAIAFREAYMEGWLEDRATWEHLLDAHSELAAHPDRPVSPEAVKDHPAFITAIRKASDSIANVIKVYEHAQLR